MPGNKFSKNDFADQSFFDALVKVEKDLKNILITFKAVGKEARAMSKAIKGAKTFQALTDSVKKAEAATARFSSTEKKVIKNIQAVRLAATDEGKAIALSAEKKRRAEKANRELAKSQLGAEKATHRLAKAVALGNVAARAASLIYRAFTRALRGAFETIKNFNSETARLAAITGKSKDEIKDLTAQAKKLGAVTQFTATQVTSLQIELGKLGFVADEIKAATPGILSFATATGATLAAAAKTAGVAVRVFGLNASETEDAVATLAIATTKSGLAFEDFDTILSTLGPVAKAYGFTLEDVIALTGELKTAGFESNKAATASRNILLNLADANGSLAKSLGGSVETFDDLIDGLVELNDRGIDLQKSLELTDKRSVAAFSRFLEGAEAARKLRDGITDVNDELQEMVDVQLDTIAGDIDLLKSAWEGFILAISSEGGVLRTVIQFLTNAVLQVQNLDLAFRKFHKQNIEQLERSFTVLESLTNKQGTEFSNILEAYADKTASELELARDALIFHFSEVKNINKKEAVALFGELVKQRKAQEDAELQALIEKSERLADEEEKREKKKGEKKVKILEDVSAQIKAIIEDEKNALIEDSGSYTTELISAWDEIEKQTGDAIGNLEDMLDEKFDVDMERMAVETEAKDLAFEKEKQQALEIRDIKIAAAYEAFNVFIALSNRKIVSLDKEAEQGIISEKKYQKEVAKIRRQQAIIEKVQALFSIAINTAIAAMKVAGQTGVGSVGAVPLIIALGALQAAAVIAEPIPQFAKGVKASPGGPAVVGEKGSELMISGNKVGLSPDTSTLMNLKRGTEIVPADITNELLKYSYIASAMQDAGDNEILLMMAELRGLRKDMKSKPVASSTLTPAGILTATHRGNTTIKRLDKFFK